MFWAILKAGRAVLAFGPGVTFDSIICWSHLDQISDGVFDSIGRFFDQEAYRDIRNAWRTAAFTDEESASTPSALREIIEPILIEDDDEVMEAETPAQLVRYQFSYRFPKLIISIAFRCRRARADQGSAEPGSKGAHLREGRSGNPYQGFVDSFAKALAERLRRQHVHRPDRG